MRVAVVNRWSRRIGGIESYLDRLLPALIEAGHDVGLWCEEDGPPLRDRLAVPPGAEYWCAADVGVSTACARLSSWRADLLYVHGLQDPATEARLQTIAPSVFFAHAFYGTCVSGHKAFSLPVTQPCDRRFGAGCLLSYFPRRCGGLSPLTMWENYRLQRRRLELLAGYNVLLTHSDYLRSEYERHGLHAETITYYASADGARSACSDVVEPPPVWRLLFLGRFGRLKGGHILLDALPSVCDRLGRPLHVTFAGDGECRADWEARAARLRSRYRQITTEFRGWVSTDTRDALLADAHVLVVPSLWPEPFGRIGPEAGSAGVPVVAFDLGGVRSWLANGENGLLAPADPPTSRGLAETIVRLLSDVSVYHRLCTRAPGLAARFTMANHLAELLKVFERVLHPPLETAPVQRADAATLLERPVARQANRK